MKIIRSTKLTLKFANQSKKQQLTEILGEYSKVVNFFINMFWNEPTTKAQLLKSVLDKADTWLCARTRKVAAREAIDMIRSAKEKAKECEEVEVKPTHYGKRMCFLSTNARIEPSKTKHFDAWCQFPTENTKLGKISFCE